MVLGGEGSPFEAIRFKGTESEVDAQWLEARSHGIGGSDVSTIMGFNPYKTPYQLWLEKTGAQAPEDISGKPAVIVGNALEGVVRRWFASQHPELQVQQPRAMFRSRRRPWAQASLDGVCRVVGTKLSDVSAYSVLECKTCSEYRADDWEDGVPTYYLTQVTHYLSVLGWQRAYVAVLIGNREFREYRIDRDEEDVRAVDAAVDRFWNENVLGGREPEAMAPDGPSLLEEHPAGADELVQLAEEPPSLSRWLMARAGYEAAKAEKERCDSLLKQEIGDGRGFEVPRGKLTWVRSTGKRYDYKRLDAEHPGLRDKYVTTAPRDGGLRWKENR